jgi:hypothetical protein
MKERMKLVGNVLLFLFATLLLATIQTSLWFQIFGYFPSPALWIPVLIYVALNRSTLEAIIYAYLTAFVLASMTAMPEGVLMISCLGVALTAQVFKKRIYWVSASYIMMVSGLGALLFQIYHWGATYVFGEPISSPAIIDWIIEALLTPLAAPVLFPVFRWFDRVTDREPTAEIAARV